MGDRPSATRWDLGDSFFALSTRGSRAPCEQFHSTDDPSGYPLGHAARGMVDRRADRPFGRVVVVDLWEIRNACGRKRFDLWSDRLLDDRWIPPRSVRTCVGSTRGFFLYGGTFLLGVLPTVGEHVSWHGHLTSAIAGGLVGYFSATKSISKPAGDETN